MKRVTIEAFRNAVDAGEAGATDETSFDLTSWVERRREALLPPSDQEFELKDVEFLEAPELDELAAELIGRYEEFAFLLIHDWEVTVLWKRAGGTSGGQAVLGRAHRPSGLAQHWAPAAFCITLSADNVREAHLDRRQVEALLYHELCHLSLKTGNGTVRPATRGHDVEMFHAEVARYGPWSNNLRAASQTFAQARLPFGEPSDG